MMFMSSPIYLLYKFYDVFEVKIRIRLSTADRNLELYMIYIDTRPRKQTRRYKNIQDLIKRDE